MNLRTSYLDVSSGQDTGNTLLAGARSRY